MKKNQEKFTKAEFKKIYILVMTALIFINTNLNAQNINQITGVIKATNDSLLMGNVLLLSMSDSSLIKGAFFMNGTFEINSKDTTAAILKIIALGYNDTTIIIPVIHVTNNIGVIYLQENALVLDEISVIASIPLIKQSVDGITTANVKNTLLSSSSTPFEVLSKLPNLIVNEAGVSVVGKGEALIYLDGKRVSISQISSMQVSQINKVEIINNPSAKYDAQGKAVINIISTVNNMEGLQGKVMQNITLARHPLSYTALNLNWRKGKWSLASDYGIDFGTDWGSNLIIREVQNDTQNSKFLNNYEHNSKSKYVANYRLGTNYQINKKSNVTIEYLGAQNINEQDSKAITVFLDPSGFETKINAKTTGELSNQSSAININYLNTLDTLGSKLFIGGQYSTFSSDNESYIHELIESNLDKTVVTRLNKSSNNINFINAQFDIEKHYLSGLKLDYGAKFINASNIGKVDFYSKSLDDNDFTYIPDLSNDFEYSENIPAVYLQFSNKLRNELNLAIGVRGEYTNAKGNSLSLSQSVIDTSYINFFPNASIQMVLNNKMKLGLSYSSSINRPSYQALDPFLFYVDSLTSRRGNPKLQPEYAHSIDAIISYKAYFFKIGYSYIIDAFRYAMLEGENGPNSTVLMQLNVQAEHSYFTSLSIPVKYKNLRSVNILGVTLDKIQDDRHEFQTDDFTPRAYLYSKNSLLIDKIGRLELNAQYLGARFDGIYYRKSSYTVSMGVSRSFLDNKLNCSFMMNDLLRSFEVDGYYELSNSKVSYVRKFNSYFYRLSVSYNFGKLKEDNYQSRNVGKDSDTRIRR